MQIVLASSSSYRKALLEKILPDFEIATPNIDESRHHGESFIAQAQRLAYEKAQALIDSYPNALIIGSDQVACLGSEQLGKPLNAEGTFKQLKRCQGQTVNFHTGLCLFNSATQQFQSAVESYQTKFRALSDVQIKNHISKEPAFDCAGGFKMEGLGIALFEKISGDDPNILVGLPLIRLISMLENEGVAVL